MLSRKQKLKILKAFGISLASIVMINIFMMMFFKSTMQSVQALSKFGSKGTEVSQIQQKLKDQGFYWGSVDGTYGKSTEDAVIKYQQAKNLRIDGIAGAETLRSLGVYGNAGANQPTSAGGGTSASKNDSYILAKMISAEARGEPFEGQVAVGAVIMNRVKHPSFPNTIAGVLYQPGAFTALTDGQYHNEPISESAHKAAAAAINGWDPTGGAIYYFNPSKTSNAFMHSRPVLTTIGSHVFCM